MKNISAPKRKDRPSSSSLSAECNNSPDQKRSRAEADETFEAPNTMEALEAKMEAILKYQLNEVHTRMASIEDSKSRLDSEVKVLKSQKKNLEKKVDELEGGLEYIEEDINDLRRDKKLENVVRDLKKQIMYMETYSRRESLK